MKALFLIIFNILFLTELKAQVLIHKFRNSISNSSNIIDSAQKSLTLQPNFSFTALNGINYQSFLTGGEINLDWPKSGQVFQRMNNNTGWVYVKGNTNVAGADSVIINATVVQGGVNKSKKLAVNNAGDYEGAILLAGGDYSIQVKIIRINGIFVSNGLSKNVSRVGVGEVIMAWGHSFMSGDEVSQSAVDERSRTVTTEFSFTVNPFFQNTSLIPINFVKITSVVGPFNGDTWFLGGLADDLVQRLNVPVLIYSAAFGGSNIFMNKQNITNQPFGFTWFGGGAFQNNRFPYRNIEAVTQRFLPYTGLRGVITHHGINDVNNSGQTESNYESELNFVINNIRNDVGLSNLSFFLAFENAGFSLVNNPTQNIVNADPNIYPGVDLRDANKIGPWRDNDYGCTGCGHFDGLAGLNKLKEYWIEVLPTSFFNTSPLKEANINSALKTN